MLKYPVKLAHGVPAKSATCLPSHLRGPFFPLSVSGLDDLGDAALPMMKTKQLLGLTTYTKSQQWDGHHSKYSWVHGPSAVRTIALRPQSAPEARPPEIGTTITLGFLMRGFWVGRTVDFWGLGGTGGPKNTSKLWGAKVFWAAGAAQTPKIDDFRPAQKACIKNLSVSNLKPSCA